MRNTWLDPHERVLTAMWTPAAGIHDLTADLPDEWLSAIHRIGHDLHVRQFGGNIDHIEWVGEYDDDLGVVIILTNVTRRGRTPGAGWGGHYGGSLDSDQETIVSYIADSVQDTVGDTGIAWPWGDAGGFVCPRIEESTAVWYDDRQRRTLARIGELTDHPRP